MALLSEYAITPDVFDSTSYSHDEVAGIHLRHLKEILLNEGIIRDLRDGYWFSLFSNNSRSWHHRGIELLKKLRQQRRLHCFSPVLPFEPATDVQWCDEALASHEVLPLSGVIASKAVKHNFQGDPIVASIEMLPSVSWWAERSCSVRPVRTIDSYRQHLNLILQCSNSIMFIDPHLDPSRGHYRDFISLLRPLAARNPKPLIEIHRVCYLGSGQDRKFQDENGWIQCFTRAWRDELRAIGISVEIFIWEEFHDRHLITDLLGISLANGLDTTTNTQSVTTWTRIGRADRDDIQKEFDRATNRHNLKYRFRIPE